MLHSIKHPSKSLPATNATSTAAAVAAATAAAAAAAKAQEGLDDVTARVYAQLARADHGGASFVRAVRTVLDRETQWLSWKKDKCPPIEYPPDSNYLEATTRRREKRANEGEGEGPVSIYKVS